jgi:RNA polymerase sigma factor (sigma-70 family)
MEITLADIESGHLGTDLDNALDLDRAADSEFRTLFEEALAPVPASDEPGPRQNPFLRVAYGRKLLTFEQEQELGRRMADSRQAMTAGLSRFAACTRRLIAAWDDAIAGARSPGDVLQWPSGNNGEDGAEGGSARRRMAELSLRFECWQQDQGADALEAPMDIRKMFIDIAPAFSMLCELQRTARDVSARDTGGSRRRAETISRALESVHAAELKFSEARRIMVECNLRLVFSIAGKFVNNGIAYDDLVQEGTIGLMRAVEKFQPSLGFKFSTYASNWIWQAVTRAIANQRRTVRVPAHVHDKMIRLRSIAAGVEKEHGRSPSVQELAQASDLSPEVVARALNAANRSLSLDAPVRNGEDTTFVELTPDASTLGHDEALHQDRLTEVVNELIAELPQREATILHLRLGLAGNESFTLEEIGSRLGITRERTRQLQNRALDHLRSRLRERNIALS